MTASSWAAAGLICLHLSSVGALPRETHVESVQPYLTGERDVRVVIADRASRVHLRPEGIAYVEDASSGKRLAVAQAGALLSARPAGGVVRLTGPGLRKSNRCIRISPAGQDPRVALSVSDGWGRRGHYAGSIYIYPTSRGLRLVEHVNLETYVSGVVAAEMPSHFPLEAMKAQTVAARTYALYHLGGHLREEADLCGRVHCQAYGGMPSSDSRAAVAARESAGQVLIWNGLVVDAMYHSACGGKTATAWQVRQGKLLPYLRQSADSAFGSFQRAYCAQDHDITWTRSYSLVEAGRLVSSNLGIVLGKPDLRPGRLQALRVIPGPDDNRVQWLKVYTHTGTYQVRGDAIRWLFGGGRPGREGLRSTSFEMKVEEGASGRPRRFLFSGKGHGHGIGLCQWGARGRALAGQQAPEILAAYYPGARLVDLAR